jgi:hypothetical protein
LLDQPPIEIRYDFPGLGLREPPGERFTAAYFNLRKVPLEKRSAAYMVEVGMGMEKKIRSPSFPQQFLDVLEIQRPHYSGPGIDLDNATAPHHEKSRKLGTSQAIKSF